MSTKNCNVAGITFRIAEHPEIAELRPVGCVQLEAEPDNKFDKKAIKVIWQGVHIGYVPKSELQDEMHSAWKAGRYIDASVEKYRCMDNEKWDDEKGSLQSITLLIDTHPGYSDGKDEYI